MLGKLVRVFTWSAAHIAVLGLAVNASADTLELKIGATGTIAATPVWQDSTGKVVERIDLDFTGIAKKTAAVDVDSKAQTIKLVGAAGTKATLTLVAPTGCKIGSSAVADGDVQLLNNGAVVGASFDINPSLDQAFTLRFAATGNYGTYSGSVSCADGSLTYGY